MSMLEAKSSLSVVRETALQEAFFSPKPNSTDGMQSSTSSLFVLGSSACNPLKIVPVSGTITFDGGVCPRNGFIYFVPLEIAEGLPRRTGMGTFKEDGAFAITSFQPEDGLIPGKYAVRIKCVVKPTRTFGPQGVSYVADEVEWPELMIEPGTNSPVVVNIDLPAR